MIKENEDVLKIQQLNIEAYAVEVDGEKLIKPFEPDYKRVLNTGRDLRNYLSDINLMVNGLYQWYSFLLKSEASLKAKQSLSSLSIKTAYEAMCNNGLLDWLPYFFNLPQFYTDVTGDSDWTLADEQWTSTEISHEEKLYSLEIDIELINSLLKCYIWWAETVVTWHYYHKITPAVFEDAFITLARCDSLAIYGGTPNISLLYTVVTGKQSDTQRLDQIFQFFSPVDR